MENKQEHANLLIKDHSVSGEMFTLEFDSAYQMYNTTPKPAPDQLGRYYESDAYVSHTDSKETLIEKLYAAVKRYTLRQKSAMLLKLKPKKGTLLDIGAGTGDFLLQMHKCGWSVMGVEPNTSARNMGSGKGVNIFSSTEGIALNSVDLITMWHVLEHVPDVHAQFTEFNRLLKPDGMVVIAVPNFKSYDASHYGEYWAAYDVPRHLSHFSRTSISKFAEHHNFVITEIRPMKFDSFYVSLLSEKYRSGTTSYLNAFLTGMRSNIEAAQSGEYSSLIYVLSSV